MEKKNKYGLIKAIGIFFLVFVVLSWFVPTGYFSSGSFVKGTTSPLGIFDILRYPIVTLTSSVFVMTAIVILAIGGLYAVLNKTGVYGKFVENVAKKFKGKESWFLVISILVFTILTSLTALTLPMFVLVPFFVAVILLLGYGKITALMSTVGAILIGNMASTYGFNVNGYVSYFFSVDINKMIGYRVLFFVLLVAVLMFFVLRMSKIKKVEKTEKKGKKKEEVKEEKKEIPFLEVEGSKKKSAVPMIIIIVFMMVLVLVGMYNWTNTFKNFTFFTDIHEAITEFSIGGFAIFKNILGSIDPIGYWANYELTIMLVLASLVIGWIYGVKFKDIVSSFIEGAKKMVPVAIYTMIASIIFLLMNSGTSDGSSMYNTMADGMLNLTKTHSLDNFINVGINGVIATIGGLFYNDFPYMLNSLYGQLTTIYKDASLIGLIYQGFHGLVMLLAPTSVVLVAGLKYLDVPYTDWLKNIWKIALTALAVLIIILIIVLLVI